MRVKTTKGDVIQGHATMALTGHSIASLTLDAEDLRLLLSYPAEDVKQWMSHKLTRCPPEKKVPVKIFKKIGKKTWVFEKGRP